MPRPGFDAAAFRRDLRAYRSRTRASIRAAVAAGTATLAAKVAANAPVLSGQLGNSVAASPVVAAGDRLVQHVSAGGGDHPHAAAEEFGTHDQPAHPFFRPAIDSEEPGMIRRIERAWQSD